MPDLGSMLTAGLGGGLTQLGDYQRVEKQRQMVQAQQAAQLALQQAGQSLEKESITEAARHNAAMESLGQQTLAFNREKDLSDTDEKRRALFDQAFQRTGIAFLSPETAYQQFGEAQPSVPSMTDSVLKPFQQQHHAQAIKALMDAAGPAFQQAAKQNVARVPIPGSEQYGGAFASNSQYNPTGYLAAQVRTSSGDNRAQAAAINKAVQNIQAARNGEVTARRATIGDVTKFSQPQLDSIDTDIKHRADLRARAVAASELAGLKAAWPGELDQLTVEDLLGEATQSPPPAGSGQGGPASTGVNPLLPHGSTSSTVRSRGPVPGRNPLLP